MTQENVPPAMSPAGCALPPEVIALLAATSEPYLITGTVAAFQYHRWLSPPPGLLALKVHASALGDWEQMLARDGVRAFTSPPSQRDVEALDLAVVLDPTLTPALYARRRMVGSLSYEAPEDLVLTLLARSRGETSIAEAAAILITQHEQIDWDYLAERAIASGQARPLGILGEIIRREAGTRYVPTEFVTRLRRTPAFPATDETRYYPLNWQVKYALRRNRPERIRSTYPDISAHWNVTVTLPRHVIAKVVADLRVA